LLASPTTGITNDQEHAHSTLHKSNAILFENGALANEASLLSILLWFHKNFNLFPTSLTQPNFPWRLDS
jgi:hypothetical protein